MSASNSFGTVDLTVLAVLLLSLLVGLARGLTLELLSLLGWVVAYVVAHVAAPWAAPHLPIGPAGSMANHVATFMLVFIVALVLWAMVARLASRAIKASPLAPVDRLLGAAFGLLRGLALLLVAATLIALTPWAHAPAWQASNAAVWLNAMLHGLAPVWPPAWSPDGPPKQPHSTPTIEARKNPCAASSA